MRELYPEIEPVESGLLDVGDGHQIYYEDCGSREGIPVVFLHGGPGSGAKPHHRQYFDPERYRVVIFDQRGSGRSQPHGHLPGNTTQNLLADMETLRRQLGIDRWLIFGGSWGATLALLYAEQYPRQVLGLVIRGTFLARARDYQWLLGQGADRFFPEYWAEFQSRLEELARLQNRDFTATPDAIINLLYESLAGGDETQAHKAAEAWAWWTGRVVTYTLTNEFDLSGHEPQQLIEAGGIELHYARNAYFIDENQILDNIAQVPNVPTQIIHGRRDMVCTLSASWAVHQALPHSGLTILPDAGHLGGEPAMIDALVTAADDMAKRLS